MGTVLGLVAALIALAGVLAALGHAGYLMMLSRAAKERGLAGASTQAYVNGRWKLAGGTLLVALIGLILTSGGAFSDVLGILVAGGAGLSAKKALDQTRANFNRANRL